MGSIEVFLSLQEIFPQIDPRILRAVAIENPNDVDAAAESILVDVLPSLPSTVGSNPLHTSLDKNGTEHSSNQADTAIVGKDKQPTRFGHEVEQQNANHLPGQAAYTVTSENNVSNGCSVGNGKQPMFIDQEVERDTSQLSGQGPCENTISNGFSSANLRLSCLEEADSRDLQAGIYSKGLKYYPVWNNNVTKEFHINPESEPSFDLNSDAEDILLNSHSHGKEMFMDVSNQVNVFLDSYSSAHDEFPLAQPMLQCSIEKPEDSVDVSQKSAQTLSELPPLVAPALNYDNHIASMEPSERNSKFMDNKEKREDQSYNVHGCKEQSGSLVQPSGVRNLPEFEANATASADVTSAGNTEVFGKASFECGVDKLTTSEFENPHSKLADVDAASEFENPHSKLADVDAADLLSSESNMPTAIGDNVPTTLLSRSGHSAIIDHLEDLISDAESNKKNMLSAVEVTTNMMREVELIQERSKQAKEAASSAGQDILSKVEELKKILEHTKEANDMHSGEVYGEKAILATECRELQSRLLSLSDERNKSLSVIEEIRKTLEARAAAMVEEIAKAEQDKVEKEALAYEELREQEAIMASVVEESKKLQQEAEMNSKLRDFLTDRGCMVDALQGEIAVICEDVMLLKEIVDGHVPLGRSLHLTASSSSYYRTKHSSDIITTGEPEHVQQTKMDDPPADDGWEILKDAEETGSSLIDG